MPSRDESLVSASRPNDAHGIMLQLVGADKQVLRLGDMTIPSTEELTAHNNSVVAFDFSQDTYEEFRSGSDPYAHLRLLADQSANHQFDVVLVGGVIERTVNTRLVLEGLRHLIKPDGCLVLAVPNVAHGDVRLSLLLGEFRYGDRGLIDRSTVTFFTYSTLVELLKSGGFTNIEVHASTRPIGNTEVGPDLAAIPGDLIDVVLRDPLSRVYQYIVKASPIDPNEEPRGPDDTRLLLVPAESALGNHSLRDDETILRLQVELDDARVSLDATTRALEKRSARCRSLEQQLNAVHDSFTWRIGRFFMLPVRIARRLFRH